MYVGLYSQTPIGCTDMGIEVSYEGYERMEIGDLIMKHNGLAVNAKTINFKPITETIYVTGFCIFINKDDEWYFASGLLDRNYDSAVEASKGDTISFCKGDIKIEIDLL